MNIQNCDVNMGKNILHYILDQNNIDNFLRKNPGIHGEGFKNICRKYGFPSKKMTVVVQNYYIDAAYRDIYYNYWAKFHFNWPRHCKRISLFRNAHECDEFWNDKEEGDIELQKDYLGTIIVRPSYVHNETEHTFGRTLLNPYKMVEEDSETGEAVCPFPYVVTATYKMHLLGKEFVASAFPFSSQDGIAMKCAETAIYCLCDFESTSSSLYARILPSDIQNTLNHRTSERILPSHGMYCNDISYLLKEFGYSPMIYAGSEDYQKTQDALENKKEQVNKGQDIYWDNIHKTDFKNWFHYYVESGIPILTITSFRADEKKHAVLAIGHARKQKTIKECKPFKLGDYPCIDSSQLYDSYIINDDNQIPYVEERMDHFTLCKNYKLEAFIVPLEKHVFLEAAAAVSICDAFIENQKERLKKAIDVLIETCYSMLDNAKEIETKKQLQKLIEKLSVSIENPLVIRYYLANSADYKKFRIKCGADIVEKKFYADILMPKAVWCAEISTYQCYKMGYSIGEVVLDATASSRSKVDSVILLRISGNGVYRSPDETYKDLENKLQKKGDNIMLPGFFERYSNFEHCK